MTEMNVFLGAIDLGNTPSRVEPVSKMNLSGLDSRAMKDLLCLFLRNFSWFDLDLPRPRSKKRVRVIRSEIIIPRVCSPPMEKGDRIRANTAFFYQ